MPISGYTGISFPFRISDQGSVVTSSTSANSSAHIDESIKQILGTNFLERTMEADVYSSVNFALFEPNDESLQQVVKSQIVDDLMRLEKRINLTEDDISLEVDTEGDEEFLYASITYFVTKYQKYYNTKVKVGALK